TNERLARLVDDAAGDPGCTGGNALDLAAVTRDLDHGLVAGHGEPAQREESVGDRYRHFARAHFVAIDLDLAVHVFRQAAHAVHACGIDGRRYDTGQLASDEISDVVDELHFRAARRTLGFR